MVNLSTVALTLATCDIESSSPWELYEMEILRTYQRLDMVTLVLIVEGSQHGAIFGFSKAMT